MNSISLRNEGLIKWHEFSYKNEENVKKKAGNKPGYYAIRLRTGPIPRLNGTSDILYIGSSTSSGGLKSRIKFYFNPGPTQFTSQRINEFLTKNNLLMDISFKQCKNSRQEERRLIEKYIEDHWELPPLNRRK